ncbi:MAG: hypothetical protein M3Q10_05630 [Chloroflexota bacterium]|nr:hypothetical protein [Chloroflexota bacterium]
MPRSPRWSKAVAPAALAVLLSGAAGVAAQGQDQAPNEAQAAAFDRVAEETAMLRELPIDAEIVEVFLSREGLAERLPRDMEEDYPAAEAEADSRAWAAFGLIPPGTDLRRLYTDLLAEQVAGFYDPETNEMFVIGGEFGALEEFTYSHEVVHALQDQHLGLDELIDVDPAEVSDDEGLATTSLFEGDATVASLEYVLANPALAARIAGSALVDQPDTPVLNASPAVLALWLMFPYLGGQPFVEAIRAEGGWAAVDAAYADPPVSSEQILHPEKYLERDEPTPVALLDLAPTLGAGWEIVDENNLGEFQVAIMLANLQPGQGLNAMTGAIALPDAASAAAAGWDGDWYQLWGNGDREVLAWRSVWDGEEDAVAFADALRAYDEGRFGGTFAGETPQSLALATADRAARIERVGNEVTYVLAPDAELAEQTMAALRGA